ncbi:SHOCT domain-containing protein [Ihubacter sp. mB4P-1]|uniref:SHOCT domain-containing protein n=1 Tax=Ihubacter sp. mB4P-1 TaxID=3242370 RepID=UPI003C7B3AA7
MAEYEYEMSVRKLSKREFFCAGYQERYKTIVSMLESDEYVLTFFWAYIYIYIREGQRESWRYVLTNKRIITKRLVDNGIECVRLEKIKDIIIAQDGNIIFELDGWYHSLSAVYVDPEEAAVIKHELEEVLPYIRQIQEREAQKKKFSGSPAEEIRRFKELCDDGIITEEEFEDRKRELLKFKYVD